MYYVSKRLEISAAHRLELDYPSKCTRLHGHNWIVTVHCRAAELNASGMVTDFTDIKKIVSERLDHSCLNDTLDFNPTAENIAGGYATTWQTATASRVQESEGNYRGIRKRLNGKSGKTNNKTMKKYRVNEIFYSLQGEGFYSQVRRRCSCDSQAATAPVAFCDTDFKELHGHGRRRNS